MFSVAVLLLFAWRRPRCVQLKYLSAEQFERRGAVFVKPLRLVGCFLWTRDGFPKYHDAAKAKATQDPEC